MLHLLRRIAFTTALPLASAVSACGGDDVLSPAAEEIGQSSEALDSSAWLGWNPVPGASGDLQVVGTPVACRANLGSAGATGGALLFQRAGNNRYQLSYSSRSPYTAWQGLGTRTFSSKPACAALDGIEASGIPTNNQFAVVGRSGSSNQYYVRVMKSGAVNSFGVPPDPPTLVRDWAAISPEAYVSAPVATVQNGGLFVLGRKANNSFSMRARSLTGSQTDPFGSHSWDYERIAPALPAGCSPIGDPAMIHTNGFYAVIATRAVPTNPTASCARLYYNLTQGTHFGQWLPIASPYAVASDPSLEIGNDESLVTLYFRANNGRIYQASMDVDNFVWGSFTSIKTDTFVDGPGAVGGPLGTDPSHLVFARKGGSNTLYSAGTHIGF